jgi:hypothetical protein
VAPGHYGFTINHRCLNLLVPRKRTDKVTIYYTSYIPLDLEDVLQFLSDLQCLLDANELAGGMAELNLSEEEEAMNLESRFQKLEQKLDSHFQKVEQMESRFQKVEQMESRFQKVEQMESRFQKVEQMVEKTLNKTEYVPLSGGLV